MILAFESSCDETSVAVVDGTKILANEWFSQIRHHKKWGGVVPELASRLHCEVIDTILNRALDKVGVSLQDITHIANDRWPWIGRLIIGGFNRSQYVGTIIKGADHSGKSFAWPYLFCTG